MKTSLLFISLLCATILYSQDFCTYNSETTVNIGDNSRDSPFETIELENGKYLIVGTSYFSSSNSYHVSACRMNGDDTIDETFGTNGRMDHTWEGRNTGISAALQSDGKILTGGYQAPSNGVSGFRPYVGRLNADGSVDESFGVLGSARLEIQASIKGSVVGIKELEDGKILAAAVTSGPAGFALIRLTEAGNYDLTLNGSGHILHQDSRVHWQTDYGDALFLSDGSVVIVSKSFSGGAVRSILCKLDSDGERDSTFADAGMLEILTPIQGSFVGIHAALDNDENILIATSSADSPIQYRVTKVFSDTGMLDSEFGEEGMSISSAAFSFSAAHDITVDPSNGDIYVVGTGSASNWSHSIWKIDSSGNEQNICDGGAFYVFPVTSSNGIRSAKVLSDGSLKLAGEGSVVDPTDPNSTQNVNFTVLNFSDPTGVNEIELSELSIYPNPARDQLNISIQSDKTIESIRIINQLGQTVITTTNQNQTIDLNDLDSGIYFAEIILSEGRAVRKFVKD